MAAGKWKVYNTAKEKIGQGIIDLDTHVFKIALFLSTSNCNTLTHDELGDLTNQVAGAFGYTTGGLTLSGVTWIRSGDTTTFDSGNVSWNAAGGSITARFAVIYDDTVSGDPLLAVCLLDTTPADVTATNGFSLSVNFAVSGIFFINGAISD